MDSLVNSGFYVSTEKGSLFMMVFEEALLNLFKIIPHFGPVRKDNIYEVKFMYTGSNRDNCIKDSKDAKLFLLQHENVLRDERVAMKKLNSGSSSITEVIDLEHVSPATTIVDLTEPDLTVLDMDQLTVTMNQLDATLSHIDDDDDEVIECTPRTMENTSNGNTQTIKEARKKWSFSSLNKEEKNNRGKNAVSENKMKIINGEHKNKNTKGTLSSSQFSNAPLSMAGSNTDHYTSFNQECSTSGKIRSQMKETKINYCSKNKNKLKDLSNILGTSESSNQKSVNEISVDDDEVEIICQVNRNSGKRDTRISYASKLTGKLCEASEASIVQRNQMLQEMSNGLLTLSSATAKPLSGTVLKYFTQVNNVVKKGKQNHVEIKYSKRSPPTRQRHVFNPHSKISFKKQKGLIKNKIRSKQNWPVPRLEGDDANIYNPNPYEVDKEGLRPVVVDGSNVAVGHGKGKFSIKGIQTCVDFFAKRGHTDVKIFLPQFREEEIPEDVLTELKTKCSFVFTPSKTIRDVRVTSYDDRFIVQYAVETGGVIVSTDNYRDLLAENPRWRDTIHDRLLMFTWVDDVLMFPKDPLGRNGPTLEEFLHF